jgi:Flp pilus assembly pilin Flp
MFLTEFTVLKKIISFSADKTGGETVEWAFVAGLIVAAGVIAYSSSLPVSLNTALNKIVNLIVLSTS